MDIIFDTWTTNHEQDEITLAIKLKAGDQIWVLYDNKGGIPYSKMPQTSSNKWEAYFTGSLLYKI